METAEIRRRWLRFFGDNGHTVVPSAPLPFDDPNLLFVAAGMVPFVPYFIGQESAPYKRATSVQKCVRTLDIEEVGKTTRHGTFFQMNGNFSFGDYFKEEAIRLAWQLSTGPRSEGGYGLDGDRIWATVYLDDDEAIDIWRRVIGLPADRIVRRGMADNFWSMTVPGPCGPCSELYYDRGPAYGTEGGPAVDEDRYMEFWNLVFMQNERGAGPAKEGYPILGELPRKNIDTGMGLERMATLLQGVDNLYEIDETRPVLDRAAELAGKRYGGESGPSAAEAAPDDVRLRVIADHVRTGLMLVADGVTPSNEGRGYVLRRILRRAVRSARMLGGEFTDGAVLPQLLPVSRDAMAPSYPELATDYDRIAMIAYGEEDAFRRTLASGTTILDVAVSEARQANRPALSGERAFTLHDTYGFPIDLTIEMAAEAGLSVDQDEFRRLMSEQRQRAKDDARSKKSGVSSTAAYRALREHGPTIFTGYETLETESRVRGIVRKDELVEAVGPGETVEVVLDATSFYAESGGQIADEGVIIVPGSGSEARLRVLDVQRPIKGLIVHRVHVESGELRTGAEAVAQVDPEWRLSARQAHSGTHVVHAALREVLGPSALQSGSYNKPGYLRLDFAWSRGLDERTRTDIEETANRALRRDLPVAVRYMPLAQAREEGALALFGETYDAEVRVVEIGGPWSRELCGGTHVSHSSQIGALAITGESSVGAGVRRIEAFVGLDAIKYLANERALVAALADLVKVPPAELPDRIESMIIRLRNAERELDRLRAAEVLQQAEPLAQRAVEVAGVQLLTELVPAGVSAGDLRTLAVNVRDRLDPTRPAAVLLASAAEDRLSFVATVNKAGVAAGRSAGDLVKVLAQALGARGGGKADLAQGAGGKPGDAQAGFEAVRTSLLSPAS
ncbi:alanine--tRNA ligase [Jatrophihabitans sp.]|uniref:alanine--tRNA ligase n=1 Tax=Jatrophihabitans sp. TaxID=1932789 RepID=UPI002BA512F3|nr:alanine--tRNA ligase [Jatrophihabitans sp.]